MKEKEENKLRKIETYSEMVSKDNLVGQGHYVTVAVDVIRNALGVLTMLLLFIHSSLVDPVSTKRNASSGIFSSSLFIVRLLLILLENWIFLLIIISAFFICLFFGK